MSYGTYRQYDSRWGKKNYNGSSNYATAACGPTSCANILYEIDSSITPLTTGRYMQTHGYAIRNQGTSWNGIPACLKHFGARDVRQVEKMADIYSLLSKGYVGVFLFTAGTRGGVTWTTSGHFVAVTGYKHANGKHYFKTFDSGGRKHDGWYCYETTMKGLIRHVWLCDVRPPKVTKPKTKYSGPIPKPTLKRGSSGQAVKDLQRFLNWYHTPWKLAGDGLYGTYTEKCVKSFQRTEGLMGGGMYAEKSYKKALAYQAKKPAPKPVPQKTNQQKLLDKMKSLAWAYGTAKKTYSYKTGAPKKVCKAAMKKYGWADNKAEMSDCGNFVSTVVRESGVDSSFKALHGVNTPFPKSEAKFNMVLTGREIPSGFLKPADIIRYKKKNGKQHAMFYYGDGKVCEASHHSVFGVIRKDTKRYNTQSKKNTIQVLRVKE
jgi:hypothetical protein